MANTQPSNLPLVVDLDGTLTRVDSLVESVLVMLKRRPWLLFMLPLWLLQGRAGFKHRIAREAGFDGGNLPWRADFLTWLQQEHQAGRRLILATAADTSVAQAAANKLGIFEHVIASSETLNLKGTHKRDAIRSLLGNEFAYAGDSSADLPIWEVSTAAVLVGVSPRVEKAVRSRQTVERTFANEAFSVKTWLRAMRVHQWVKNLLLFVPIFTAFTFDDASIWGEALLAFVAFSLTASATYILNDLWDLDSDRAHPRKQLRPFASGHLSAIQGIGTAGALLVVGVLIAAAVSGTFLLLLLGYLVLTTAYSLTLKTYVLIDVLVLAMLYTYRVIAGSVATGVEVTPWLFAFSVFTFFSLALVKRCAELVLLKQKEQRQAHGRDYRTDDLVVLWPLGIGASLCAVLVFGLYVGAPLTLARYNQPDWLWLVAVCLMYWFSRLWIKTVRGEMHDDPIVFALRDRGSRWTIGMILLIVVAAHHGV